MDAPLLVGGFLVSIVVFLFLLFKLVQKDFGPDPYGDAALSALNPILGSYAMHGKTPQERRAAIEAEWAKAAALPDRNWRDAYQRWIRYYSRECERQIAEDESSARRQAAADRLLRDNPPEAPPHG